MADNLGEDDYDWSGQPDSARLKFSDNFEKLPPTAPANHAHIIDLSSYDAAMAEEEPYDMKVWDVVLTMLYNISEKTANDFLDSGFKTVQLKKEHAGSSAFMDLIVWRQGSEVMIAQYSPCDQYGLLEFDNIVRCRINIEGSWTVEAASFGKYSRTLEDAWAGRFVTMKGMGREIEAEDSDTQVELVDSLVRYILSWQCWEANEGSKWTIKTT